MGFEVLDALRLELGEGAREIHGRLHVVDIPAGVVYRRDEGVLVPVVSGTAPLGAVAALEHHPDMLVAVAGLGVGVVRPDPQAPASVRELVALETPDRLVDHRVNDAAVDPHGALWVGVMSTTGTPTGSVYRVSGAMRTERLLENIECPNGPAFGPGGVVYLADTTACTVLRSRLDPDGTVAPFSVHARVEGGFPDGMTVDQEGCLWMAVWGAGEVRRLAPDGRIVERYDVGASQPTSVCLTTLDGEQALVVTSARQGLRAPRDGDGAIWAMPTTEAAWSTTAARLDSA